MSQASSSSVILNWSKGSSFRFTDYRDYCAPTAQNLIQAFCHIFHILHTLFFLFCFMSSSSPLAQRSFCIFFLNYYYYFLKILPALAVLWFLPVSCAQNILHELICTASTLPPFNSLWKILICSAAHGKTIWFILTS